MNENFLNELMQTINSLPPPKEENTNNNNFDNNSYNDRTSDVSEKIENISPDFTSNLISKKSINILGFNLYFDDIILLCTIIFLLQEEKKDYILIGILGLMFFNITFDNIKDFEPLNNLLRRFS